MTIEQKPELEFSSWTKAISALTNRQHETSSKFHTLRKVTQSDFNVKVRVGDDSDYTLPQLDITVNLTSCELNRAPSEVQMVLADLGLSSSDEVISKIRLSPDNHDFHWTLRPSTVTDSKIGIIFYPVSRPQVIAPTEKAFDGVHQYVDAYFGNGDRVYRVYGDILGAHPYLVSILSAGAEWMVDVINNRRKSS